MKATFLEVFLFQLTMRVYFLLGVVALVTALDDAGYQQQQQNYGDRVEQNGGGVIDKIFNIPITAVKQTSLVAQSFTPENKQMIDNVFQIPISTLEAVSDLVKSTTAQRRENADVIQKRRQDRRDRLSSQREEQKLRKEQIQNERLRRKSSRYPKHQNDPFGLNTLTKILIGNHGIFNKPSQICSIFGNYQNWFGGGLGSSNHDNNHGSSHGGHEGSHGGSHEIINGNGYGQQHGSNMYQVHEIVDEGNHQSIGTFFGQFSLNTSKDQIRNKIAPSKEHNYYPISDRISTKRKNRYYEPPLENKIAPRNSRISFV
ncbi:PREDICTED: uncharacterized protein LOC107069065 isoform X1 [Polistes dominula]|uniref:Uncharacterized protein LOC107069065 isoform X1 n=1 Tax=Polistes dominula TaxID=743375 RepID=A0ABM1IMS0_POLDO|nr:PREDICTED: uncharacterized protein LOC107069065 isoform X1 [Polistes dominula]